MADVMSLPRVTTNERTITLWTNALRAYEGKSSELIPPGPRSHESVQLLYGDTRVTWFKPFGAPEPLPILNPSNFVPKTGFQL